jgi:hypothetical protein
VSDDPELPRSSNDGDYKNISVRLTPAAIIFNYNNRKVEVERQKYNEAPVLVVHSALEGVGLKIAEDKLETILASINRAIEDENAKDINETFAFTGERQFNGRIQIAAVGVPCSRFTKLWFFCIDPQNCEVQDCPLRTGIEISFDKNFEPSAFATYFDSNNPIDALSVYIEKHSFARCADWRNKVGFRGYEERAITTAIVNDLTGREGLAWFVHGPSCDLRRAPNWIIARGYLCRGRRGRIGVLVHEFKNESEVTSPPRAEVEKAKSLLKSLTKENGDIKESTVWKLAELLRKKNNAKGEEVTKGFAADLLLVASPVWVVTPESGDRELGATIIELGPTTNYKSQRGRFLIKWLGVGKYLRGRKTEAGLTAGLEKIEGIGWAAKKGALPSADLSFIIVDNADPHALDEQIESRRDGIVSVTGIKQMEVWARTRLKLLNNPYQSFDELVYKCVALKMFDPKLIARFTFAIYTYSISIDERYSSEVATLTEEEGKILEALRTVLLWNLSIERTYEVPSKLWPLVMELSKQLESRFGVEDIPLLLRNIPYKLAVLASSFALLEGEDEPNERHFDLAYKWLEFCAQDIELDKYATVQRTLKNLLPEEFEKIKVAINSEIQSDIDEHGGAVEDSYIYRILDYLVKHGVARVDELAAFLEVDERTVKRKTQVLKGLGLLRSGKDGYTFTPKGVRFVKRYLSDVPDDPHVTTSGAHSYVLETKTNLENKADNESQNVRVPSKSGDIKDNEDTKKQTDEPTIDKNRIESKKDLENKISEQTSPEPTPQPPEEDEKKLPHGLCQPHYRQLPTSELANYEFLAEVGYCEKCGHKVLGIFVKKGGDKQ